MLSDLEEKVLLKLLFEKRILIWENFCVLVIAEIQIETVYSWGTKVKIKNKLRDQTMY